LSLHAVRWIHVCVSTESYMLWEQLCMYWTSKTSVGVLDFHTLKPCISVSFFFWGGGGAAVLRFELRNTQLLASGLPLEPLHQSFLCVYGCWVLLRWDRPSMETLLISTYRVARILPEWVTGTQMCLLCLPWTNNQRWGGGHNTWHLWYLNYYHLLIFSSAQDSLSFYVMAPTLISCGITHNAMSRAWHSLLPTHSWTNLDIQVARISDNYTNNLGYVHMMHGHSAV
jgi:hypothetical protein